MTATGERASLLKLAEDLSDVETAVSALLLGHDRDSVIGWTCGCGHRGQLGESHAAHQAAAVMALLRRRGLVAP